MYLHHEGGTSYFSDILNYINRSKSQLSVALKKLEKENLILKNNSRPMLISITDKGSKLRQHAIKTMVKYNTQNTLKGDIKPTTISTFNLKQNRSILNENMSKRKEKEISISQKTKLFDNFINEVKTIVKEDLTEYFEYKIPLDLIRDITRSIYSRIHDKLFDYF